MKSNAFCTHADVTKDGRRRGVATELTFALKDVFDVEGVTACAGNPDWLRTHRAATRTAPAVDKLLDAGASLRGLTITDELTLGLNGENFHYGTPTNPAAPDRVPGGSSCGSAAAVAGGLVDFALGTDTGGSVRVPASYCGIFGFRPTHGRVSNTGVVPLAPSFDTVGWFARDLKLMRLVGEILLENFAEPKPIRKVLIVENLFRDMDAAAADALRVYLNDVFDDLSIECADLSNFPDDSIALADLYRTISGYEEWVVHGQWITQHKPTLGPQVAERFGNAAKVTLAQRDQAERIRRGLTETVCDLLKDGMILCAPATPDVAPLKGHADIPEVRLPLLRLTALAGLAGLPAVSVPLWKCNNLPMGVSFIAGPNRDEDLLALADKVSVGLIAQF
ncbi:amidase [Candidatus Binatus sp.]|uniref:amidase n=1 Tax=Candidatus Binatus sp. TaxID=2811406 RepID=UPI003BB04121